MFLLSTIKNKSVLPITFEKVVMKLKTLQFGFVLKILSKSMNLPVLVLAVD